MRKHRELRGWAASMEFVEAGYRFTDSFPDHERFGLTSQLRRAAVSIPSNIAEGASRGTDQDFSRFVRIARASVAEIDTQLELAYRLGYGEHGLIEAMESLSAQLGALAKSLRDSAPDKSRSD